MRILSTLSFTLALLPLAALADCYDLSNSEPRQLSGQLSYRIFAGPPNYEDVQKGDTPEAGYILKLGEKICLKGDADFADPTSMFDEVQLVETDATSRAMAQLDGRMVTVQLSRPMPAHTGHHHRPLVAWVEEISTDKDITEEYGTAASTVRAFYLALAAGNGETAAQFIVAEKRRKGPFSAKALAGFYGSLAEPLELVSLDAEGANAFLVRYRYKTGSKACDGTARIITVEREGASFIKSIKANDGC